MTITWHRDDIINVNARSQAEGYPDTAEMLARIALHRDITITRRRGTHSNAPDRFRVTTWDVRLDTTAVHEDDCGLSVLIERAYADYVAEYDGVP